MKRYKNYGKTEARHRINERIRDPQVRLIGAEGEQIGIVDIERARELANTEGLDLVEVSPNADPPVCKILDYGKFRYDEQKRKAESKKKQHIVQIKELRLRPKIEEHDFQTKLKHAVKFLSRGDKVQFTVLFRGREMGFLDRGREVLRRMSEDLSEMAEVERHPKMEGRRMHMIVTPTADVLKSAREQKEAKQKATETEAEHEKTVPVPELDEIPAAEPEIHDTIE